MHILYYSMSSLCGDCALLYISIVARVVISVVSKSRFMWLTVVRLPLPWWVARHLTRRIIPHPIDITVVFAFLSSLSSSQFTPDSALSQEPWKRGIFARDAIRGSIRTTRANTTTGILRKI